MDKKVHLKIEAKSIVVRGSKNSNQRIVTIPMNSNINVGDKVVVYKVVDREKKIL